MSVIHHYIPALRKADNVPGMYDISWDLFYPSETSDPFIAGSEDLENTHNLPGDYQELQWISSTGTQYFNTGYMAGEFTIVRCTFEVINPIGTGYNALYGAHGSSGVIPAIGGLLRPSQASQNILYQYGRDTDGIYTVNLSGKHTIEQHMNVNLYDGVTLGQYPSDREFIVAYGMYVFAQNHISQEARNFSAVKMYELIIAENDIPPGPEPPTPGTMNLYYNNNGVDDLYYNGHHVEHLVYNGNPVE